MSRGIGPDIANGDAGIANGVGSAVGPGSGLGAGIGVESVVDVRSGVGVPSAALAAAPGRQRSNQNQGS